MKPRNTVVLVIIAHIGLFLIWMCMGGCSLNRERTEVEEIRPDDVVLPEDVTTSVGTGTTEVVKETDITPRETVTKTSISRDPTRMTHDPDNEVKYVVQKGDTIWGIAKRFNVSRAEIIDRNDIQDPAMIRPGRELYIPKRAGAEAAVDKPVVEREIETESTGPETVVERETVTESETETAPTEMTTATGETELDESQYLIHEVVAGDTIWKLARTYKVTTDEIIRLNGIDDPRKIQIGQKIKVPKK